MFIKFRSLCVRGVGQSMLLNPTMCTWHYLYLSTTGNTKRYRFYVLHLQCYIYATAIALLK